MIYDVADVCFALTCSVPGGWRYMFGFSAVLAILQLALMLAFMPRSPRWLMTKKRLAEAQSVLLKIRSSPVRVSSSRRDLVVPAACGTPGKCRLLVSLFCGEKGFRSFFTSSTALSLDFLYPLWNRFSCFHASRYNELCFRWYSNPRRFIHETRRLSN